MSLQRILDLRPDLVVIAGMVPRGYEEALHWRWDTPDALVKGYVDLIRPLRNEGLRVAVILDNPYPTFSVPDCVQRRSPGVSGVPGGQDRSGRSAATCSRPGARR